jgi:hypothetical protein
MNETRKHMAWKAHTRRPHGSGTRRTDMYGFERYEDERRNWYILSGEEDARRHAHHDLELERRCSTRLMALIFGHMDDTDNEQAKAKPLGRCGKQSPSRDCRAQVISIPWRSSLPTMRAQRPGTRFLTPDPKSAQSPTSRYEAAERCGEPPLSRREHERSTSAAEDRGRDRDVQPSPHAGGACSTVRDRTDPMPRHPRRRGRLDSVCKARELMASF